MESAAPSAFGGIIFGLFFVGVFLVGIASLVFWIWAIIDCASNESSQGNDKIVWILIIVFLQIIGALVYFFVRRPQRKQEQEQRQRNLPTAAPPGH